MTNKEFENIGKELASQFPGFVARGQLLFIRPINGVLRGIFFDRSIDKRSFYAQMFALPLCIPAKFIWFNFGWRLGGDCTTWNADDSNLIRNLTAALKREAIPFLSLIKSPGDLAGAADSLAKSGDIGVQQAVAFALARGGEVNRAVAALDRLIDLMRKTGFWIEEIQRARALRSQLLGNPIDAQRQLDSWEEETVKNLGLETVTTCGN